MPERDHRPRTRRGRARPAAVAVLLGLLASVGVLVASAGPVSAATSCSGPIPAGQIRVVLVVDPGPTGPRGPMATCLVVSAGASGAQILAQRAGQLGLPSPRYGPTGLMCGLDGFPGSGCPVSATGAFDYWAYFNGVGGGWSYGSDNPFARRMADGEIMGWRYTLGSADGQAATPRIGPSAALFPPLTPVTAPPATDPPATAPPPAPAPSGGGAAPVGGGGATTGGGGGAAGGGATASSADGATDGDAPTDDAPGDAPAPDEQSAGEGDTPGSDERTGEGASEGPDDERAQETVEVASAASGDGGSGWVQWAGVAVASVAVGGLAIGAVTTSLLRSRS